MSIPFVPDPQPAGDQQPGHCMIAAAREGMRSSDRSLRIGNRRFWGSHANLPPTEGKLVLRRGGEARRSERSKATYGS